MKVTAYNHHARLLSSRALGRFPATSLLRSEEPTLSCNQFSTFDRPMSGLPPEIRELRKFAAEFAMLDECQGDWVETEVGVSNELEGRR